MWAVTGPRSVRARPRASARRAGASFLEDILRSDRPWAASCFPEDGGTALLPSLPPNTAKTPDQRKEGRLGPRDQERDVGWFSGFFLPPQPLTR